MVVNERHETETGTLILNAALECLADEAELKSTKAAEIERMAAAVAAGVPEHWAAICAVLPRMRKRGQNAVALGLLARRPPITDAAIFAQAARQMHQLDHHVRAGLVARLARLGDGAESGRQLILTLQNFEKESSFRVSSLAKVSANDLGELHRLLTARASELMLFPRSVLRLSLDWTVRLQGSTVERRTLISQMPRLLAKLKWRDLPDALIQQYFTTIAEMGEGASLLFRTLEWGLLFKFILKHLRTRATGRSVLLELGRLLAACRAELPAKEEAAAPKVNRVTYDPQSGAAWTSVPTYPPHIKPTPAVTRLAVLDEADDAVDETEEAEAGEAPEPLSPSATGAAVPAAPRPRPVSQPEPEPETEADEEMETAAAPADDAEIEEAVEETEDAAIEQDEEAEADEIEKVEVEVEAKAEAATEQDESGEEPEDDTEELEDLLANGTRLLQRFKAHAEQRTARLADLRGRLDALRQEVEAEAEARRREREQARELERFLNTLRERLGQTPGQDGEDRMSA